MPTQPSPYPISVADASGRRVLTRVSDTKLKFVAPEVHGVQTIEFTHHSQATALWLAFVTK